MSFFRNNTYLFTLLDRQINIKMEISIFPINVDVLEKLNMHIIIRDVSIYELVYFTFPAMT